MAEQATLAKSVFLSMMSHEIPFSNRDVLVGMNDYVTKPFNPKDLFFKIAKYNQRQIVCRFWQLSPVGFAPASVQSYVDEDSLYLVKVR